MSKIWPKKKTWIPYRTHSTKSAKQTLGMSKGKLNTKKETSWWNQEVKEKVTEKKRKFKSWQDER